MFRYLYLFQFQEPLSLNYLWPILEEAEIKLLIDLKNLEENLIAIEIDKNNNKVTITI